MARSSERTYDPATGQWTKSTTLTLDAEPHTKPEPSSDSGSNLTSSTSDSSSATGSTEKEYNTIEYNTLNGSLNFIANEKTIKLKAGDTVTLKGLGKYLSGDYYVQDVTRSISSSGYSHSATLIKTDFGATLKTSTTSGSETPKETEAVESTAKESNDTTKTHTLKKGETLWGLAVKYYNDGSKYTKIATANNITAEQFNKLPIGKKLIIP